MPHSHIAMPCLHYLHSARDQLSCISLIPAPLAILQDQQQQGAAGSLMLFKHSIVVVDEQDRAWPVQVQPAADSALQFRLAGKLPVGNVYVP